MLRIVVVAALCLLAQSCATHNYEHYTVDEKGVVTKIDDEPAKPYRSPPDYPAYLPDHFAANYVLYRRAVGVTQLEDKDGSCVVTLTVRNEWDSPAKDDWLEILFLDIDGNTLGESTYTFDIILPGNEQDKQGLAGASCCRVAKVYVAATPLMRYDINYHPYQDTYWDLPKQWPEWYLQNCN